ncbi:TolC family protein [Marinomonas sp. TW1]|uniref:TolC family protein n=1 Tax=Marinomonas sp. TW1 TaxID=1561203 RepID=UPI0007AEEC16|nr:TolC family protein [Marinomonas sp. TW1]KZN12269.1 transporter [Marinomonas sp. TW1]
MSIKSNFMGYTAFHRTAVASAMLLGLTACSVTPTPITFEQKMALVDADRQAMFENQEPITKPISLEEAMARAVKYNLKERLALMEKLAQDNILGLQSFDMLPSVAASAGWKARSNEAASSSKSIATGSESLVSSTSQDKQSSSADLTVSWNVLDFGIGYFGSKAQANNVLAAEERRRSVVADIIQKVRGAYWEAVTAQELQPLVKSTLKDAYSALNTSKKTAEERLISPLESLQYQKSLLEMISRLETLEGDLATAKSNLASLMNLPPATQYELASQDEAPLTLRYQLEDLEMLSMVNRPEINEEAYRARNAVLETRSSLMRLLPGASLFVGAHYNSNSYSLNNDWADAGVQVSWNLLSAFSYSDVKAVAEAKENIADLRRQALRMAVLTQVNLAWQQYKQVDTQFQRAAELSKIHQAILEQSTGAYQNNTQSLVDRVRVATESVLAKRNRDRSFAMMQSAYGAIYKAAGLDPLPKSVSGVSVENLSASIAQQDKFLQQGHMTTDIIASRDVLSKNVGSMSDYDKKQAAGPQDHEAIKPQLVMLSTGDSLQETTIIDYTNYVQP